MSRNVDNTQETLDSRDIQERIDELQEIDQAKIEEYETEELNHLLKIKESVGDDESWGFGITFIRDSYFEEDSEEFAYGCGDVDRNGMIASYVNWEEFADSRKMDFESIEFDGIEYWYRL